MKTIGLIGFGLIGQYIKERLGELGDVKLGFVYDMNPQATASLPQELVISTPEQLVEKMKELSVDLVVEAATYQAVQQLAPLILPYADMMTFSSCAFADEKFESLAKHLCSEWGRKIYIPHGAVLGYDGIFDGREVLEQVCITTTKKPKNLGSDVTEKTVLFEGSTREACKKFPRNVNVHAGIAIAGLGFDKTCSRIVADPDVKGNTHKIEVTADGVQFDIEVCSIPKGLVTGAYTPLSAFSTLKRVIGGESGLMIS
ncbi:aspartate dehydrogenase domain-containing protein [Clostridium sp.]